MKTRLIALLVAMLMTLVVATNGHAIEGSDWDYDPYAPAITKMAIAHGADLLTTAIALSVVEGAVEGNPLGWTAVALKGVVTFGVVPFLEEGDQVITSNIISGITYGAVANNTLIIAGASGAVPIVGFVLTSAYLLACDFEVLPDYVCITNGYDTGGVE